MSRNKKLLYIPIYCIYVRTFMGCPIAWAQLSSLHIKHDPPQLSLPQVPVILCLSALFLITLFVQPHPHLFLDWFYGLHYFQHPSCSLYSYCDQARPGQGTL